MQRHKKIQWTLRLITLAALITFIFVYTVVYLKWWVFAAIPALFTFVIAWLWPVAGGFLMLLIGIPAFYNLFDSNYDFQLKLPAYILCLIFIASGLAHVATSYWARRVKIKRVV